MHVTRTVLYVRIGCIITVFLLTTYIYSRLVTAYYVQSLSTTANYKEDTPNEINVTSDVATFLSALRPPGKFYPLMRKVYVRSSGEVYVACDIFKVVEQDGTYKTARKVDHQELFLYNETESTLAIPTDGTSWKFDFNETGKFSRSPAMIDSDDYRLETSENGFKIRYYDTVKKRNQTLNVKYPVGYQTLEEKKYLPCLIKGPSADFYFPHPNNPVDLKTVGQLAEDDENMFDNKSLSGIGAYVKYDHRNYGHCQRGKYSKGSCEEGSYYAGRGTCYTPSSSLTSQCLVRMMETKPTVPGQEPTQIYLGDSKDDRLYYHCSTSDPFYTQHRCERDYERFDYDESNKCVLRNPCFEQTVPRVDQINVAVPDSMKSLYPNSYVTCFSGGTTWRPRDCSVLYPGGILTETPPFNYCVEYKCRDVKNGGNGWTVEHSYFEPNKPFIVGTVDQQIPSTFREMAFTKKTTCSGGRVINKESASLVEYREYIFKDDSPTKYKFYVKYTMPEFIFDANTGEKIVCNSFRDAVHLFAKTGKLRVYSQLTSQYGVLNFISLSLFVDVRANASNYGDLIVETCASKAVPILLSSTERDYIDQRAQQLGGYPNATIYSCSWVNKETLYKYDSTKGVFSEVIDRERYPRLTKGYGYYSNSLSAYFQIPESSVTSTAVAVLLSDDTFAHSLTNYYSRILRAAEGFEIDSHSLKGQKQLLGYTFEKTLTPKVSEDDANTLEGRCVVATTDPLYSALMYLKNSYVFLPHFGVWCMNGQETFKSAVPCTHKMGLTDNNGRTLILNTCGSLEIVKPPWIGTLNDNIVYTQYTKPTFIANTVSASGPYTLKDKSVVNDTSTLLTVEEYLARHPV